MLGENTEVDIRLLIQTFNKYIGNCMCHCHSKFGLRGDFSLEDYCKGWGRDSWISRRGTITAGRMLQP